MKLKKKFFGWANLRFIIKELVLTMSDKPSVFSKKRVVSYLFTLTGILFLIIWFCYHFKELDYIEIIALATLLFTAAGHQVNQIQKEKKFTNQNIEG